jgi:5-methylcytosine-specific restriction enzyme subunit McrC
MTIPIRNLYYLFLYAWARFPGGALVEVGIDKSPDLPNLFAKLLVVGIRRLFRRGLNREYETFTEEMLGLRGRLRLDRMIKETTQLRATAICDFDELTHDILHNQVLKATLKNLASCVDVENGTRHELRYLIRRFYDVADIRLSASHFRRIAVSRTNREYIFLMRLCEFVFWSLLPDETGNGTRFQQVLEDEVRMSAVFEDFLRNFYQLHRPDYSVRAESIDWDVTEATEHDLGLLPRMVTDITLRHPDHTIVIDAKFYQKSLAQGPYGERVRSQHLYQLVTYLQHARIRQTGKGLSGMLIYPQVDRSLRLHYRLLGIPVMVATIDLSLEWRKLEAKLHELLGDCASAATGVGSIIPSATGLVLTDRAADVY